MVPDLLYINDCTRLKLLVISIACYFFLLQMRKFVILYMCVWSSSILYYTNSCTTYMEIINSFLNLVALPFTFVTLLLLLPPYAVYKLLSYVLRCFFLSENVAGKVVLITGASSGIGEHLAYEYGRQGACLALAARREDRLHQVAHVARELGSPDVLVIAADVSKMDDCKLMVDQTVDHFGRLDHLVNNAGIASVGMFEEMDDITAFKAVMEINFWGPVYTTRFAVPHLRNSNGKVIVISSADCWLPMPRCSLYNASKAAVSQLFETLRIEFGSEIKVTIVTPGFVDSEITQGKGLLKGRQGQVKVQVDKDLLKAQVGLIPVGSVMGCCKAIVRSACRGDRYLVEPVWLRGVSWLKLFCPEILDKLLWLAYISKKGASPNESFNSWAADLISN